MGQKAQRETVRERKKSSIMENNLGISVIISVFYGGDGTFHRIFIRTYIIV